MNHPHYPCVQGTIDTIDTLHSPLLVVYVGHATQAQTHILIGVVGGRHGVTPSASQNLGMLFIMCVMMPTCVQLCGTLGELGHIPDRGLPE